MDMFDDCNVELVVRDAVESGECDSTLVDDCGDKKLSENPNHPRDSLLACCDGDRSANTSETPSATERLTVGQVHVSCERTERPNSLTPGLQRDTDTEWELLNSNIPITNIPCASISQYIHGV